ncbi:transmembrane amino acid transporter protein-domain-containing protein, partial [Ochromonadaceae sp. CCMP2298]
MYSNYADTDEYDSVSPAGEKKLMRTSLLGDKEELIDTVDMEVDEDLGSRSDRLSRLSFSSSFSALHPTNSAPLTCFLLLNTMIGSGILNQPYVFAQSGIIGGLIGFAVATVATWTGLLCLTAAGLHENVLEYSGLAHRAFDRTGELLIDISIIVLTVGSQLGYILVVGVTLSELLVSWGCNSVVCEKTLVTILAVGIFVTPVCLFRHFGHLAYLSLFSIGAIVAVLLLVLIAGPIKHEQAHKSTDYNLFNISGLLSSTGSIVFSLACASANFQAFVSTERKSRNMASWRIVTGVAVFGGAIMCVTMGTAGYLSFGDETDGEILDNFNTHPYDFFKAMVVTHLILYIPVNFVIMRYSLVKVFLGTRSELLPPTTHSIITVVLLAAVTAVVILLLSLGLASGVAFSLILNITGGVGGSLATLIMPAAIYLKVMPDDAPMRMHATALLIMGVTVMVAV